MDIHAYRGPIVAMYAAYGEDGSISVERMVRQAEFYHQMGVKGLFLNGSSGEGMLLSEAERMAFTEAVVSQFRNDMFILVHVGAASSEESSRLARFANRCGAHAVAAVPAYYYKWDEDTQFEHWKRIAHAGELPFFIYNMPMTGYTLTEQMCRRCIREGFAEGVKESSRDCARLLTWHQIAEEENKPFLVVNGADDQYIAGCMMGANAGIGGTYGCMPELYLLLEKAFVLGRNDLALKMQGVVNGLIAEIKRNGHFMAVAASLLHYRGVELGLRRAPCPNVSEDKEKSIEMLFARIEKTKDTFEKWINE